MSDESRVIGLLHRADWTRLSLSARTSNGATVLVAPGKRYRYEVAGYVTGCDGGRPWELSDEEDEDDDGEVHWISGPEPPLATMLCPAWLLAGSRLEVRGRIRVCGRDALDVIATQRPDRYVRMSPADTWRFPADAAVDAELGILLRVAERGKGGRPDVTELVAADFDPDIDPAVFRAPQGSLRAESLSQALTLGGRVPWRAVKTAAGLAAGGLGAWIRYGPQPRNRPDPPEGGDVAPAIPARDPAPRVSLEGRAAGGPVADDLLSLLHAGGPPGFCATMHQWIDAGGLASAVPASARRSGFGGLGYLMDAISESAGAIRQTSVLRVAGRAGYQIDRSYRPKDGPVTIACDGEHLWKAYADEVTKGPAEPLSHDISELADPAWLLQCWLAGGASVLVDGRPAYRIDVVRRAGDASLSMIFPAAVAIVDAELGLLLRVTFYAGGKAVQRLELQDLAPAPASFRVDLPADLPVTEVGPLDELRRRRRG